MKFTALLLVLVLVASVKGNLLKGDNSDLRKLHGKGGRSKGSGKGGSGKGSGKGGSGKGSGNTDVVQCAAFSSLQSKKVGPFFFEGQEVYLDDEPDQTSGHVVATLPDGSFALVEYTRDLLTFRYKNSNLIIDSLAMNYYLNGEQLNGAEVTTLLSGQAEEVIEVAALSDGNNDIDEVKLLSVLFAYQQYSTGEISIFSCNLFDQLWYAGEIVLFCPVANVGAILACIGATAFGACIGVPVAIGTCANAIRDFIEECG